MKKFFTRLLILLASLYLLLLIPDSRNKPMVKAQNKPFVWKRDSVWSKLEADFNKARVSDTTTVDSIIKELYAKQNLASQRMMLASTIGPATMDIFVDWHLPVFFEMAPYVAVRPSERAMWLVLYNLYRNNIKINSANWDMNDLKVRNSIYQVLYGMRAAVEEVLLQSDSLDFDPIMLVKDEPSATPSTDILGVKVHSGDLLVSRGGAEASAMISRGNDYPGNFSHVAMVYVDTNGKAYMIEAHIEKGVAISSVPEYINDKKMRFMVLRLRADLPQMKADPMLPQKVAEYAYRTALSRHIPYDFKMNFRDTAAMFCSEVGAHAYKKYGIGLWQGESTISSDGVARWLNEFGVENFVTQMPSDLEYDPKLSVVAEWRNTETLRKDHIDNAVMDVLLEQADSGRKLDYNLYKLPLVRIVKGWCMLQNYFGKTGIIPEGMSATQALKNQRFVEVYQELRKKTVVKVSEFVKEKGYYPPYWQLVVLAKSTF